MGSIKIGNWLNFTGYLRHLGPGIIMASTAIGVSHLVQSTRAGADFGYLLIPLIILINLIKYPFIVVGYHYPQQRQVSLVSGYLSLGKAYLYVFLSIMLLAAIGGIVIVVWVMAAILQNLLSLPLSTPLYAASITIFSIFVLYRGHYQILELFIKSLTVIFVISTLIAFIALAANGLEIFNAAYYPIDKLTNFQSLAFIIALMGWMPAPLEISVWYSLWGEAKKRSQKTQRDFTKELFDFKLGYCLIIMTATIFAIMGAESIYGKEQDLASSAANFASQFINLYSLALGDNLIIKWLITLAALMVMLSTVITLIDAYPRSLASGSNLLKYQNHQHHRKLYHLIMIFCSAIALFILAFCQAYFKFLIDLVTIIAILSTPFFAYMNLRLSKQLAGKAKKNHLIHLISLILLTTISLFFIIMLVFY